MILQVTISLNLTEKRPLQRDDCVTAEMYISPGFIKSTDLDIRTVFPLRTECRLSASPQRCRHGRSLRAARSAGSARSRDATPGGCRRQGDSTATPPRRHLAVPGATPAGRASETWPKSCVFVTRPLTNAGRC